MKDYREHQKAPQSVEWRCIWRQSMLRQLSLVLFFSLACPLLHAQNPQEVLVSMVEMLQYERAKQKDPEVSPPFKKYGMKRIHASKVLEAGDSRHLWGYHVHANLEFDKQKQPLFRLFKRADFGSMAVIDYFAPDDNKCELVFWGKKYYRRFAHELRRAGFQMRNSQKQTNILEFRKEGVSVGVDVIIWPDVYILQVINLG